MNKPIFPPEIIEFSAENHFVKNHSQSKIIYQILLLFFFSLMVAMPFVSVDITTQSRGVIRTPNANNLLQTTVSGEVKRSVIVENRQVRKGDTLLWLITEKLDEQLLSTKKKRSNNQLIIADINLLMVGKEPIGDKYMGEYNEMRAKSNELTTQVLFAEQALKRAETLYQKRVLAELDFMQEKNRYEMALKQRDLSVSEYRNRWQTEKKKLELEDIDLDSQIEQLHKEKRNYSVIATADGAIIQSVGVQKGSFITAGQVLAYLSQDQNLIAECYVNPSDIGFIKLHQSVAFQFDTFNYREWGVLAGQVIEVSNDVIERNQNESAFCVRCSLSAKHLTLKNGYRGTIKKGMAVTGQFYLTRRTFAQLLFDRIDDWMNPKLTKIK